MSTSTTFTKVVCSFTIDRQALAILLSTVSKFAGRTTPYDLVDLHFEKGRLFASCFNGEAGIKAIVAAQANAEDAPATTFGVNVALLTQLVATMEGNIKMGVKDDKVEVKAGKASSKLNAVLNASLPAVETGNMQAVATLSGEALLSALNALEFASTDAARPNLSALLLEFDKDTAQIHGWTADGFAAAHAVAKANELKESCSLLLSNSSRFVSSLASMISKEDTIQIMATPDKGRVTFGIKEAKARRAMMISTPTMENTFPLDAVKQMLAAREETASATLEPKAVLVCVKQVEIMGTNTAHLFTKNSEIHIESARAKEDVGTARNVIRTGNLKGEFDLNLNVTYLGKVASVVGDGVVNYSCSGPAKPVFFTGASFEAVLMPILVETKASKAEEPVQQEKVVEPVNA